jgi:hypothetical protein
LFSSTFSLAGLVILFRRHVHRMPSPRDEKSELIKSKYLNGAAIPIKGPSYRNLKWAIPAPAISGLVGYSREEGIRLLTSGVTRNGETAAAPMPQFRLNQENAEAVVDYLKSPR